MNRSLTVFHNLCACVRACVCICNLKAHLDGGLFSCTSTCNIASADACVTAQESHICCSMPSFVQTLLRGRYPACNAHAPYCHPWPATLYSIFPHFLINSTISEKKSYRTQNVCFDFLYNFCLKHFSF